MAGSPTHYTDHQVTVDAPADVVFSIIEQITRWPQFFEPTVHADYVERGDTDERIRLWATANGEVRNWTSRRRLDRTGLRIRFEQETPQPPLLGMGGEWVLKPLGDDRTQVELKHDFRIVDDNPDGIAWVNEAVHRNSTKELGAVREIGAMHAELDRLMFSFSDEVAINGPAVEVYDFLWRADEWPRRISHVDRLDLREPTPDAQEMEMVTRTRDGATHSTTSVRLGFPAERIIYKQTRTPALMRAHSGSWSLTETAGATVARSEHTVILNPEAIPAVLGAQASIADAREFVHTALSANSTTTLGYARSFVQDDDDA